MTTYEKYKIEAKAYEKIAYILLSEECANEKKGEEIYRIALQTEQKMMMKKINERQKAGNKDRRED